MEIDIADDHDRRYKRLFSHPGFVSRLLSSFVHEPFLRDLDLSTLELVNTSFVSGRHVRRESDLVWKLTVADAPVYFYLLIEFQSGVDETMPLRFLRYLTEFYESLVAQLDRTDALPAVFPLLKMPPRRSTCSSIYSKRKCRSFANGSPNGSRVTWSARGWTSPRTNRFETCRR